MYYLGASFFASAGNMAQHRFTDRWLQSPSLTPPSGRAEYVDGLCPGLHLRVTVMGTRTFSAMYRVNGQLRRKTIGKYPVVTLAAARSTALKLMRDAQDTENARERRARVYESFSYEELVDAYVKRHLKPNARSWKNIERALRSKPMAPFFKRPVHEIVRRDIIRIIDEIMEAEKPQAAVNLLRYLKMLFNWAEGRDMIAYNPCSGVKPPAKTTERDRVLSDAEIKAVWVATGCLPAPYWQMYRMFLLTGQRRSEVSTMRWCEIDGNTWTIPREKVKKDRPHAVPLTKAALSVLATLPRHGNDGFVFTTTDGEAASSNFNKTKAELDAASGTSGWTIHDLRRTVRSKLAELGVPREVARKVLNHEDGKVDRIYNRHEYIHEKREALTKWEKRLKQIATR